MTSYCPIDYTLLLGKIFENNQMSKLLTKVEHLLHSSMHEFLPRLGTQINRDLRLFYVELTNLLFTHDIVYGLCLDFAKAFDKIDHKILLTKLDYPYVITGDTLKILSRYICRSECVKYAKAVSAPLPTLAGVPQSSVPLGSVLGPSLFTFNYNDLPDHFSLFL